MTQWKDHIREDYRSPNFDERGGFKITALVLHYTGMPTAQDALNRLCDPVAKVSAHYLVDEDGTIYALVDESKRAWHAGKGSWRGISDLNRVSIGIEIVNPGHEFGYRPFLVEQMKAVIALCQDIVKRRDIEPVNVIAHSDLAPERKEDPGELFDWKLLAENGVGLWPDETKNSGEPLVFEETAASRISALQSDLKLYGYGLEVTGNYDELTRKTVIAFQRHFRPELLSGVWDADCEARLVSLLKKL
jgi:N-acetylmuramoyl-L-alanine amidase